MGGWFNKEILSVDDLQGKMRIPGLGVGSPEPGSPLATVSQFIPPFDRDRRDELVGPYTWFVNTLGSKILLPGWHEPGSTLETLINKMLGKSSVRPSRNDSCCYPAINEDM